MSLFTILSIWSICHSVVAHAFIYNTSLIISSTSLTGIISERWDSRICLKTFRICRSSLVLYIHLVFISKLSIILSISSFIVLVGLKRIKDYLSHQNCVGNNWRAISSHIDLAQLSQFHTSHINCISKAIHFCQFQLHICHLGCLLNVITIVVNGILILKYHRFILSITKDKNYLIIFTFFHTNFSISATVISCISSSISSSAGL